MSVSFAYASWQLQAAVRCCVCPSQVHFPLTPSSNRSTSNQAIALPAELCLPCLTQVVFSSCTDSITLCNPVFQLYLLAQRTACLAAQQLYISVPNHLC